MSFLEDQLSILQNRLQLRQKEKLAIDEEIGHLINTIQLKDEATGGLCIR